MHKHDDGRKCDACSKGNEYVKNKQKESMEKYGWYCHCITDGDYTPFGVNFHTHGFPETFGVPDVQLCIPIDPQDMHRIVWQLAELLRKGMKIGVGDFPDSGIFPKPYVAKFIEVEEGDRKVLRLIVPDKNGGYGGDYGKQLLMLTNKPVKNGT